jgi:uncharacterized protein involved in exopolysaccharide biosynthesis
MRRRKHRRSLCDSGSNLRIESRKSEKISNLKQARAALLTKYTEEWWEIKQIDNQIKPLEVELQKAPTEVITAMKSRYESSLAREKMLRSSYNAQHGTTTEQTKHQIEMVAMGADRNR